MSVAARTNYPLDLVRLLQRRLTAKTWDPTVGLFWDADDAVKDLLPRGEASAETVTIVRHALADCQGLKDAPELVEWERSRTRVFKEVSTLLRRAEERLSHGTYYRDEAMKLVYAADES